MSFLFNFFGLVVRAASNNFAYNDWERVPGGEYVHKLTDETIEAFVKRHPSVFVFFYSPTCPYCTSMKPDLARAAELLTAKSVTAKIGALNATAYDTVYLVNGVPTMYFFRHGKFIGEYRRNRRASEILSFILESEQ